MDANCLMWDVKLATTLNGNCKTKHYVSQQKGKCKLILSLFRCKCLSRLVGIQGLWHQNNLFYYNPRKRRAPGAFWVTQMARYTSTIWALNNLISTYLVLQQLGEKQVQNWNPFKREKIEFIVMMDDSEQCFVPQWVYGIETCIWTRTALQLPMRQRLSKFAVSGCWTLARCPLLALSHHRGSLDSRE